MVAALQSPAPYSPAPSSRRPATTRPALRLIEGGSSTSATSTVAINAGSMLVIVAVMATMLLVLLVRGVQGAPPASDWATLAPSTASAQATSIDQGSLTVTVAADDTWATIAARVAPGVDPVEFARVMAADNGGYALREGQVLVVTP